MKFTIVSLIIIMIASVVDAKGRSSVFNLKVKDKLTTDFLTGFESGVFMRNNTKQFDEYGCPDEHVDSDEFKAFKQAWQQVKALKQLMGDGMKGVQVDEILESVELFVGSFDKFIGVFDDSYTGGDFCSGLTFGMEGAKMLEKMATTLYETHLKEKAKIARTHV